MACTNESTDFHYYFISAIVLAVVVTGAVALVYLNGVNQNSNVKIVRPPFNRRNKSNHLHIESSQIEMKTENDKFVCE